MLFQNAGNFMKSNLAEVNENSKMEMTHVPFIDLKRQYVFLKDEILKTIDDIFSSGHYILGEAVENFEKKAAHYLECNYVLSVANGTDAIILALKSLNIGQGDEVILPTNSFIATAGAVAAIGAIPVLCDVQPDLNIDVNKIESLISKKTKAIIPVHLTGRPAEMDRIMGIAKEYSLFVIEDAAQSIGARYKNKMSGTIGDVGCFSLHPLKNLHIYGDGGLIATNNEEIYSEIKLLRNHGLVNRDTCLKWGLNSRLDALHAGIGTLGLQYIEKWNQQRRNSAKLYAEKLKYVIKVPVDNSNEYAVYHNFVVHTERRDELMRFLAENKVETKIHYPIPIHLQPAAKSLGYKLGDFPEAERQARQMMSLPIYSELREDEISYVIETILHFFK
jgi:dTDP-4-amino-4,6-dideoxygalactose transaminase